jgi:hypothetical protein
MEDLTLLVVHTCHFLHQLVVSQMQVQFQTEQLQLLQSLGFHQLHNGSGQVDLDQVSLMAQHLKIKALYVGLGIKVFE